MSEDKIDIPVDESGEKERIAESEADRNRYAFLGPVHQPHKGMTCFRYDTGTLKLHKAEIIKQNTGIKDLNGNDIVQNTIKPEPKSIFIWAVGPKSAQARINKFLIDFAKKKQANDPAAFDRQRRELPNQEQKPIRS